MLRAFYQQIFAYYSLCSSFQVLLDQTDFFVVGVLGLQGSGKSTILSLLAGNNPTDNIRFISFDHIKRIINNESNGFILTFP